MLAEMRQLGEVMVLGVLHNHYSTFLHHLGIENHLRHLGEFRMIVGRVSEDEVKRLPASSTETEYVTLYDLNVIIHKLFGHTLDKVGLSGSHLYTGHLVAAS